jgi:hypothetical protein
VFTQKLTLPWFFHKSFYRVGGGGWVVLEGVMCSAFQLGFFVVDLDLDQAEQYIYITLSHTY